jgi:hypothetical protein
MAHVTGPCNTLPGSYHTLPAGTMCDDHPDVPAVVRVQTDTDSFGAEYWDLCTACHLTFKAELKKDREQPKECEWCHETTTNCKPHRDFEEGQGGRVYDVCVKCRVKESARVTKENEEYERTHAYEWEGPW